LYPPRVLSARTENATGGAATTGGPIATGDLHVTLDAELPRELTIGAGTALFVCGWCYAPAGRIRELELVVDGVAQPVMEHGMPRLDVFRALHPNLDPFETDGVERDPESPDDPGLHSYRSGFWGMARVAPRPSETGECEVVLRAHLENGQSVAAELARIPVVAQPEPVEAPPVSGEQPGPLVAVCMATYEPAIEMFERQLASIREQTHRNWVLVISDDCSSPKTFAAIEKAVGDDPRVIVSRSSRRLGFYRNFERALALAPRSAEYVAMADQDDSWHPDKLEALLAGLGDAQLVYSDARIIARDGQLIADTYWSTRRNNHTDMLSLLVANSITGAASLFRRDLLDDALPFPPGQFAHFHDHWIGLVALARGEVAFVDRPLYDYVQHGSAVLGHAAANRMTALRDRLGSLRRDPRERVRMWRMHFFVDVCRLLQVSTILRMRVGDRMAPAKRRALDRFARADRSLVGIADLALRGAREMVGRRKPETLGAEWMLAHAFAWRRMLSLSAGKGERPHRRLRLDAVPPTTLDPKPARRAPSGATTRAIAEKIAPLQLAVRDDAPHRVNLLIPTIDLKHFFGGYIGKLNLASRLAQRGVPVRIVTVDPVGPLTGSWKERLESYAGLSGLFDRVEVAFGRESPNGIEVSRTDRFIATTWWTAHIAHDAVRTLGGDRFLYLVQEYEPFTFEMGTYAALANESYRFPHFALFSTELLREYFRRHGIGVYMDGTSAGDRASVSFQNAITAVDPPTPAELAGRETRRLLFYARPEQHAARNMFEMGVLALSRALEHGTFARGWELYGIGTVNPERRIDLGGDSSLTLLPRAGQDEYAKVLRDHDVGLALMYTPHPSLVPIEMASAGMLTVTNSFENKTPEKMAEISSNLITVEPTIEDIAAGLSEAAAAVEDVERRAAGAHVEWSKDWATSLNDALMDRVVGFLES
jgi:glycosyltransferase involved in cell wall biosynthesis